MIAEDAQGRHRRHDAPSGDRRGRGLCGQLPEDRVDRARPADRQASLDFLRERLDGEFGVSRAPTTTTSGSSWQRSADRARASRCSTTATRGTLTEFYVTRPELDGAPLQPMHAAGDPHPRRADAGQLLTLPPGSDPDGDGVPDEPVPMVLLVHGGPWARDGYGFNRMHQWLANRGYAVLSASTSAARPGSARRSSTPATSNGARKMHDDLIDAVDWAVQRGHRRPQDKVAIMGGSYGGYATLAGLTFTPEMFACGVDIVGPSNLETLLETIPPYWAPMRRAVPRARWATRRRPRALQLLKDRAPLHTGRRDRAAAADRPGRQRPARQAGRERPDRRGDAEAKGIPVTYVVFPDEGHGFARPENNIAFNAVAESVPGHVPRRAGRAFRWRGRASRRRKSRPAQQTGEGSRARRRFSRACVRAALLAMTAWRGAAEWQRARRFSSPVAGPASAARSRCASPAKGGSSVSATSTRTG